MYIYTNLKALEMCITASQVIFMICHFSSAEDLYGERMENETQFSIG